MQPWSTVTGRLVDENILALDNLDVVLESDPEIVDHPCGKTDSDGRFRLDHVHPGIRYRVRAFRGHGRVTAAALDGLVLRAGEVRTEPLVGGEE